MGLAMAKKVQEAAITTRAAREKLDEGVHWRELAEGVHIGYRRGRKGGKWVARWYLGEGKYRQEPIGLADDVVAANGLHVLDFRQAEKKARSIVDEGYAEAKASVNGKPLTVSDVMGEYAVVRDNQTRALKGRSDVRSGFSANFENHVKGTALADVVLHALTVKDLTTWSQGLSDKIAVGTVRRIRNDVKAALNAAGKTYADKLPATFAKTVKDGLELKGVVRLSDPKSDDEFDDIDSQVLNDDQVRRVIEATAIIDAEREERGDLHRMILLLATTGMRLSQIARMRVGDVDIQTCTLHIPVSRKGKGANDRVDEKTSRRVDETVIVSLRPILTRPRGAVLLERRRMIKSGWQWEEVGRGPWSAVDLSKPWILIRDKAQLPSNVTPYALRHSSICRMIMQRVPTLMVAKRHNTSVEIIERHYGKTIDRAFPESAEEVFKLVA